MFSEQIMQVNNKVDSCCDIRIISFLKNLDGSEFEILNDYLCHWICGDSGWISGNCVLKGTKSVQYNVLYQEYSNNYKVGNYQYGVC